MPGGSSSSWLRWRCLELPYLTWRGRAEVPQATIILCRTASLVSSSKILGEALVDGRNQRVRWDLFDDARHDELVQALRAQSPELSASAQLLKSEAEPAADEDSDEDDLDDA